MKEQIQEMESELERFHKQNTQLELNITELRQKLKATDKELHQERQKVRAHCWKYRRVLYRKLPSNTSLPQSPEKEISQSPGQAPSVEASIFGLVDTLAFTGGACSRNYGIFHTDYTVSGISDKKVRLNLNV